MPRTFDKKLFLLDLPKIFMADACSYREHSWKYSLKTTKHKEVAAWYAINDCTLLVRAKWQNPRA